MPHPSCAQPHDRADLGAALDSAAAAHAADATAVSRGALMEGEEVNFNARIPENLRDAFQELCEAEGRSMSWTVREYMRRAVEQGETGL